VVDALRLSTYETEKLYLPQMNADERRSGGQIRGKETGYMLRWLPRDYQSTDYGA
jgi:hypothetical protein